VPSGAQFETRPIAFRATQNVDKRAVRVRLGWIDSLAAIRVHDDAAMFADSPSIFDAALNLSDADRANLAYQLLQSLKPVGILHEGDSRFDSELQRRLAAYESGQSEAADWDEVALRLRKVLSEKHSS
jgi:putative addiction module component (TIGR02574 family)